MKTQGKIKLTIICLLLASASHVPAQITPLSEEVSNAQVRAQMLRSNEEAKADADAEYLRFHPMEATNALSAHQLWLLDIETHRVNPPQLSPEDSEEMKSIGNFFLTNAAAQSSYFFHVHGMTESEYSSNMINAMRNAPPLESWPDPSKKQEIFAHCATVLRLAIDTNQIEMACDKLTNQPEAVPVLKTLSKEAMSNLDTFASLLSSPDLNSYLGAGYRAKLLTSTNIFYFDFWPSTLVRDIEKRTPDGQYVLESVRFYENGKLMNFIVNSPDRWGLGFKDDGTMKNYYTKSKNIWLP